MLDPDERQNSQVLKEPILGFPPKRKLFLQICDCTSLKLFCKTHFWTPHAQSVGVSNILKIQGVPKKCRRVECAAKSVQAVSSSLFFGHIFFIFVLLTFFNSLVVFSVHVCMHNAA